MLSASFNIQSHIKTYANKGLISLSRDKIACNHSQYSCCTSYGLDFTTGRLHDANAPNIAYKRADTI